MLKNSWKIATIVLGVIFISAICYGVYTFSSGKVSKNSLNIKAALVYSFGGAQPIARTKFYILNADLNVIAQKADIDVRKTPLSLAITADELQARITNKPSRFMEAMKPYIVKTITTDFDGKAVFEDVPTGNYFLYGRAQTRSGWAIWSLSINTQGTQTILLDQNNAIIAD